MKIVILCGGKGTRLGFETKIIPKPMAKIDNDPIVLHIMNYYMKFGFNDFILALGYKGNVIKNYFNKKKKKFFLQSKMCRHWKKYFNWRKIIKIKKIFV